MKPDFVAMLNEPKNTLGRTEEVVELVLANPELVEDLYQCYFQPDEWVRLRVSSSFKRLWRSNPTLVAPYLGGFVQKVAKIDQPSINWTFAQLCLEMEAHLRPAQRVEAQERLQTYLDTSDDWIVQNNTIETLATWSTTDIDLREWLTPRLAQLAESPRKSVAKRARKWQEKLSLS